MTAVNWSWSGATGRRGYWGRFPLSRILSDLGGLVGLFGTEWSPLSQILSDLVESRAKIPQGASAPRVTSAQASANR